MAIGKPNIADVLRGYLEDKVKSQLSDEITDKLVKDYKKKVRELVDAELKSVTFENIEHVRNALKLSEELNVNINVR